MRVDTSGGFTLIEILIAVAVVAILASIAYAGFQGQITKSKRAEGKAELIKWAQNLEKCKALYGAYNAAAGGTLRCKAYDDVTGGDTQSSENGYYVISATASDATSYTLQAAPAGFTDSDCGNLTVTEDGTRSQTGAGTNCW